MTTTPPFHDLPPLRTGKDVLDRVEQIVGPATATRTLWLFLVDGDGRQAPAVVPVEDVDARPDPTALAGLVALAVPVVPALATDAGEGSVFFALERRGPETPTDDDRCWADGLSAACGDAGVTLRGVHLVTPRSAVRLWVGAG